MNNTKIMIVEDELLIGMFLSQKLKKLGYKIVAMVSSGKAAIERAGLIKPDLILMDIALKGDMDGIKAAAQIHKAHDIPVIYLTAYADDNTLDRAESTGSYGYIVKPFNERELHATIKMALKKHQEHTEAMEQLRSSITHSLPHELRTPLTGILSSSDFLLAEFESLKPYVVRDILGCIRSSAERLSRLIQNFLLYSELELISANPAGVEALHSNKTSYGIVVIQDVALQQAQQAKREKDLQLKLQDASVQIGTKYLIKLLQELIENAFKFSQPGTPIRITSILKNNSFILSVRDQGRGMTAEQIAQIGAYIQFERQKYEQQGSGLGLAIATRLAQLHGGELTIESIPEKGTIVRVSLPIAS
ncbi:MAG: response regulator [Xenococcaceae cyanobacterium]